jgi:NAD(P)-dependent dehydrogenase (short-subunit alcohol dehydrogenase family)
MDVGCSAVSVEKLTSKPIVLVLAGNSGLGLSVVSNLLESKKWTVVATYRRDDASLLEVFRLHVENPEQLLHKVDLTNFDSLYSVFQSVAKMGKIWGVVNCCGEATAKTLKNLSFNEVENSIMSNVLPAIYATKCALSIMSEQSGSGGRIVHLSSVLVRRPVPGVVPYVMSKAAIEGLVKSSAVELGRYKITINALRLGYFDRGMATRDVPNEILENVSRQTAVKDLGHPENLTGAINYLLSNEASFHTGSVIDLDGGLV